ncbi:MAG: NAD(P)-dependent alcohol dehydrogenase [Leucobacter sp.]|nr:NAD(P)-dependent alcohol dehydrogenase [Leucobacter sp.]
MRAVVYDRYGGPEVLRLDEVATPRVDGPDGAGRVLVRIHAASVNSWDRDNLQGAAINRLALGPLRPRVRILGGDISGVVEAVGPGVTRFRPGDEVFGDLSTSGWGAFAEYVAAPEAALTRKPAGLSHRDAAAMPQAAVLALQGIDDPGDVHGGSRVLINGAGGGLGSFAVQLAASRGAEVTGVDSAPKLDLLRELGAEHVLDFRAADFTRSGSRYDVVLDCELHRPITDGLRVLADGGRYTVVGGALTRILGAVLRGRRVSRSPSGQTVELLQHKPNYRLADLGDRAASGAIRPAIERVYSLDEVPLAMQRMCEGLVVGKAVIAAR